MISRLHTNEDNTHDPLDPIAQNSIRLLGEHFIPEDDSLFIDMADGKRANTGPSDAYTK